MFLTTMPVSDKNIESTVDECTPSISINLSSEWKMMGNPYLDEISWSKIEVDNEFTGGGFWVFDRGWREQSYLPKLRGAMINGNDIDRGFIIIITQSLTVKKKSQVKKNIIT